MAKASNEEWEKVFRFVQELGEMAEKFSVDNKTLGEFVREKMPAQSSMIRVAYGYRVLVDNTCDPNADTLAWKPELLKQMEPCKECAERHEHDAQAADGMQNAAEMAGLA